MFFLFSCGNDCPTDPAPDYLIGSWEIFSVRINMDYKDPSKESDQIFRISFLRGGTGEMLFYDEGEFDVARYITWERNADSLLIRAFENYDDYEDYTMSFKADANFLKISVNPKADDIYDLTFYRL